MTRQQMEWAKQHDWFIDTIVKLDAYPIDSGYATVVAREWQDGMNCFCHIHFSDFTKLRAWAGY